MKASLPANPLTRRERIAAVIVAIVALAGLYAGWRQFWYLTDDAFIFFRYASNSLLGHGYAWNAAPFRPVEGYTSFLWLALLDLTWRVAHVAPPDSANWLSLFFSALTLVLFSLMVIKLPWNERLRPYRLAFVALGLLGIIANTTFLAWTSSGLETALFGFGVMLWVYCFLYIPFDGALWVTGVSVSASLLYLARPDGLLFAAATLFALLARLLRRRKAELLQALPLLAIPAHLAWRRLYYGEWLPNTYYAKVVPGRIWWQSGYRYLLSFVIEYGLWLWIAVIMVCLVLLLAGWLRERQSAHGGRPLSMPALLGVVVAGSLFAHFVYYTFVVGGDHFEYRVYSHLIPLLFLSFTWAINRFRAGLAPSIALLAALVIFSWPVQWLNWALIERAPQDAKGQAVRPLLADSLPGAPAALRGYLRLFDSLQGWMSDHYVCVRWHSSKALTEHLVEIFPSRAQGLAMDGSGYPVATQEAVGVLSWVLPKANIIDLLGLNDYVIARNPDLKGNERMAHERQAPPGYVDCFEPNIIIRYQKILFKPRPMPLTAQKIIDCETTFSELVNGREP